MIKQWVSKFLIVDVIKKKAIWINKLWAPSSRGHSLGWCEFK
jgi:hypothetical protein